MLPFCPAVIPGEMVDLVLSRIYCKIAFIVRSPVPEAPCQRFDPGWGNRPFIAVYAAYAAHVKPASVFIRYDRYTGRNTFK
jgi:hypothetical protein